MIALESANEAYEKALKVLTAASQTEVGLSRKLVRAGYEADIVTAVVERLKSAGYLDDRAYAESLSRRRTARGRGARLIASELRQKGVSSEIVEETIRGLDREVGGQQAKDLALKLLTRHADMPGAQLRRRVEAQLMRRGYPNAVVHDAYREALRELSEEGTD